jgi:hypothetical protein
VFGGMIFSIGSSRPHTLQIRASALVVPANGKSRSSASPNTPCRRPPAVDGPMRFPLWVTRDRREPVAGPAMSACPESGNAIRGMASAAVDICGLMVSPRNATTGCHVMPNARRSRCRGRSTRRRRLLHHPRQQRRGRASRTIFPTISAAMVARSMLWP